MTDKFKKGDLVFWELEEDPANDEVGIVLSVEHRWDARGKSVEVYWTQEKRKRWHSPSGDLKYVYKV